MRRLISALLVVGALLLVASPASAEGTLPPASSPVQLLDQTPWLQGPGVFNLRLGFNGVSPADRVQVTVYDQVLTRTDFDQDASGHVNSRYFYQGVSPLAGLTGDSAGGFDIQLPVNEPAPAHDPFTTVPIGETGVFPVQVALYDSSGRPSGHPLTTFLVFAEKAASAGMLKPLDVGLVIPVSSPPVVGANGGLGTPSPSESNRLSNLADVLNADSSVPASILASPLTLDEISAGGSSTDRSILASLSGATAGGPFEVLPSPYAPASLGDLQNGAVGEVKEQLDTGASVLKSVFGQAPDGRTWVANGPLDGATMSALIANHVQQLIVPNGDLTPLPGEIQITFAGTTYLNYAGTQLSVISADSTLTSAFTRSDNPVLGANELLAELAMIYTEAPNARSARGLAVLPPPGWNASPAFVQTLIQGLQGNPLLSAVTASKLFSELGQAQGTRYLSAAGSVGQGTIDQTAVATARSRIDELDKVLGSSSQVEQLKKQLLLAESSTLSAAQRSGLLAAIGRATNAVQHVASLPPATTITLTSTKGQIPLTILAAAGTHPRIQLALKSQKLIFQSFSPREGTCTVISESDEICLLSLSGQNTTLHVPVETRSSGVFPLDVYIEVPGTARQLAHRRDTVRSTAVSGVAVVVIIVALAGLALWWGRDLRRGRRPRGMVPSPVDATSGDPAVEQFFDEGPPGYDGGNGEAVSPSGVTAGPTPENHRHGRARETREM